MEENSDTATLAYIRHVLSDLGISATALANKAGIAPTTLTRPLNNNSYKFNLSATTLEKIAKVSGINPGPFFENKDYASIALASVHDKEIYNSEKWPEIWQGNKEPLNCTAVIGRAGLGFWQDLRKTESVTFALFLTSSFYVPKDCFSVYMIDGHAGDVAREGEFAFCVRHSVYKEEPVSGQHVVLERRRDEGRLVELTIRRLQKVKTGWQLNTPGRGRLDQDQVVLPNLPGEGDAVVIGIVEYGIRSA